MPATGVWDDTRHLVRVVMESRKLLRHLRFKFEELQPRRLSLKVSALITLDSHFRTLVAFHDEVPVFSFHSNNAISCSSKGVIRLEHWRQKATKPYEVMNPLSPTQTQTSDLAETTSRRYQLDVVSLTLYYHCCLFLDTGKQRQKLFAGVCTHCSHQPLG